jgi:hypothetical protein
MIGLSTYGVSFGAANFITSPFLFKINFAKFQGITLAVPVFGSNN